MMLVEDGKIELTDPDYLIGKGKGSKPLRYDPPVSEGTIVTALDAIERKNYVGIDHKKWIAIGCGILKELGEEKAHDLFKQWSERGSDYSSNFEEQWDSIVKKDGYGWSIDTLLKIANEADPDWRAGIPREEKAKPAARPDPDQSAADTEPTTSATYTGPLLFDPWAPFIVPDFPFDVLPPVLQEFVASQSVVIGGDPSAMAMVMTDRSRFRARPYTRLTVTSRRVAIRSRERHKRGAKRRAP
jgi:hypothetical protein